MNDSKKRHKYTGTPLSFEWKPPGRPVLIAHGIHTIAVLSTGTLAGAFPSEAIIANGEKLAKAFNSYDRLRAALSEIEEWQVSQEVLDIIDKALFEEAAPVDSA